ncbi:MAG: SDR family oxidoreductase [Ginsengibacter sp.]
MNQKVLVTAGAGGIGLEIVKAFAATGAKVFVCDINETALKELEQQVPGVITSVCDISKRSDIESMVTFGAEALGGLDVLVNNAGIAGPTAPVEEINPDDWEKVMQIDINGTFNVTRMAIQSIKQFVDPKDIAALALFLASDSAKMISGQIMPIDGDMQKAS